MQSFLYEEESSQKISKILNVRYGFGHFYIMKLIRKGDVKINGRRITADCIVNPGDRVEAYGRELSPDLIYGDDNISVFYKPYGIISDGENSFEAKVKKCYGDNFTLCHRLDLNTSGLIIFAKNTDAFDAVCEALKRHNVEKYYLALVHGKTPLKGEYKAYLTKDSEKGEVKISTGAVSGAKEIITEINPLKFFYGASLLEVKLITGRTHQIRAHLAFLGFPIIGDERYGNSDINELYRKHKQMLVSYKLKFNIEKGILSYLNGAEVILDDKYLQNFYLQ